LFVRRSNYQNIRLKNKNSSYILRENIPIAVIGFSYETADVIIREKGSFNESRQNKVIYMLSKDFNARGSIIVSTCNRTEIYVCGRKVIKYMDDICLKLDKITKSNIFSDRTITYILTGRQAIQHFFRVITSLDSQIVGEPQITGQVKNAYEKSRKMSNTDILLNRMYNFGMQTEKKVRSKTKLTEGAISVCYAGVDLAREKFGNLINAKVLIIGAGETAQLAAEHFSKQRVSKLFITNRTFKKAENIAKKHKGNAIKWQNIAEAIGMSDIIISSTSSNTYVIDFPMIEKAVILNNKKSLLLIDLAMPRDIQPSVAKINGVNLFNLDSLKEIVENNIEKRKKEIPKAEKIVDKFVEEYIEWYNTLPVIKTITQLSKYFEEIRELEFKRLKNRFSKVNLEAAEYLSKSLMKKFLHQHIISLRRNSKNPDKRKQHIDLVDEIYRLNGNGVNENK